MKKPITACLTGPRNFRYNKEHNDTTALKDKIKKEIINLIEHHNVKHFVSGMALGVDMWGAQIVLELKKLYPIITLECVLACETQANWWNEKQRERYFSIIAECDKETLLQTIYTKGCMMERNKFIVDASDFVLAVFNGVKKGGTYQTIKFAQKMEKAIVLIGI